MQQREIKFKVWDKPAKKMMNPEDGYGLNIRQDGQINERYILLQYTGLKDKNGKDIYEGDILNYDKESFANGLNGLVEWCGSGFYMAKHIPLITLFEKFNSDMEVIGNIYENPDLIN